MEQKSSLREASTPESSEAASAGSRTVRLGYATNVFRGDSLREVIGAIEGPLSRLRAAFPPSELSGIELRLGGPSVEEIASRPQAKEQLRESLRRAGLTVLTMNGFSPRGFHGREVKENAYHPTWLEPERLTYTRELASILSDLLPPGAAGAISTSPGSFKSFGHSDSVLVSVAEGFAEAAFLLAEIESRSGKRIVLSIEPEPGCTIENTAEFVAFFEDHLLRAGVPFLSTRHGLSAQIAEVLLRRHLAATFDTCHLSVQFEDLVDSAERLTRAGIRIAKVHATSGLRVKRPREQPDLPARLASYARSPYLHQVAGVDATGAICLRASDLERALVEPAPLLACEEVRIHFHLPLFVEKIGPFATTSDETVAAVRHILGRGLCDIVVLETYTWDALREVPGFEGLDVEKGIAQEIRWARERLL